MNSFEYGRIAEDAFISMARGRGAKVELARQRDNFDFVVNGHRIEFKAARPQKPKKQSPNWLFNLHHHNVLKEGNIDFYILCFQAIPYMQQNLYGAVQAPAGTKTLGYGMADLLKHAESLHRLFEEIVDGR